MSAYQGRFDEGLSEIELAYELNPTSRIIATQRGFAYLWRGHTDQATSQYRKALDLESDFSTALYGLGLCYEKQSNYPEAIVTYKKTTTVVRLASLGYAYAVVGQRREARSVLKQLQELFKQHHTSSYYLATVHAGLGIRIWYWRSWRPPTKIETRRSHC